MSRKDDLQFLTTDLEYSDETPQQAAPLFPDEADDTLVGKLGLFKGSRHPGVALFHVLFKGLALATYLFAGLFTSNFVLVCVVCILLLAFDFWTVKNVSGRLMVGLRWWNYVKEDGSTEWVFESADDASEISDVDRRVFWGALYAPAVVWSLFLLVAILQLKVQWLIVIAAALCLSGANIVGYTKCSKEARQQCRDLDFHFGQDVHNLGAKNGSAPLKLHVLISSYEIVLADQLVLRKVGCEVELVETAEQISAARVLVFPGVGSFGRCMEVLRERGWVDALRAYVRADKPYLGICLGLQTLFDGIPLDKVSVSMTMNQEQIHSHKQNTRTPPTQSWRNTMQRRFSPGC